MSVTISTKALLFDLDGTLVYSIPAVEKSWLNEVQEHNKAHPDQYYEPLEFVHSCHGTRTVDVFKKYFPYKPSDEDTINNWEQGIVSHFGKLGRPIHGAPELLDSLNKSEFRDRWAVVTSGTRPLAHGWFERLFSHIDKPSVFITANDVTLGKPNPEGYTTAFEKISSIHKIEDKSAAIVFEDAPVGIASGINAGFIVIGIATTFDKQKLLDAGAKYVVEDMTKVTLESTSGADITLKLETL